MICSFSFPKPDLNHMHRVSDRYPTATAGNAIRLYLVIRKVYSQIVPPLESSCSCMSIQLTDSSWWLEYSAQGQQGNCTFSNKLCSNFMSTIADNKLSILYKKGGGNMIYQTWNILIWEQIQTPQKRIIK